MLRTPSYPWRVPHSTSVTRILYVVRISRDVLKTYVDKHTITYAKFHLQTNQICIIISTEVSYYPWTFTATNCFPLVCRVLSSVVLGDENSRENPLGHVPRDNFPGGQNPLQQKLSPRTTSWGTNFTPTTKNSNAKIGFTFSPFHHWWTPPQKTYSPLDNFTISPLHHIMISPFNHMCKIY